MTSTDLFGDVSGHDVLGARTNARGSVVITKAHHFPRLTWLRRSPRDRRPGRVTLGGVLLAAAAVFLAGLAVSQGWVSWHQQFIFDLTAKPGQRTASALEAIGLDSAAVIFAILGIALARLGRPARIERVLVAACSLGSMVMNLLGADLASPRSVAVYVMPPVLFAAGADRLIAVIRRSALGAVADDEERRSAWRVVGVVVLYGLRLVLAPPSTALGVRRLILAAAPLPDAAALPAGGEPTPPGGEPDGKRQRPARRPGKGAALISLAADRHDLTALPLADVSAVATTLAPEAEIHPGTARRVLLAHVRQLQKGSTS